ncbi:MAG: hypothetical protein EP318_01180 [Rhodobacteraceae bacterium]|nr:MAG: hypothetical protein EP318_01180 [Paracoccaceae bacterium]
MTDAPDNVTLRYLRRIDEKVDRLSDSIADLASDVRGVKTHMAGFMQNEIAQDGALASVKARLDRIERRLDISGGQDQ